MGGGGHNMGDFNNGGWGRDYKDGKRLGVDFNIWSTIIHISSKHVLCDLKNYQHS